MTLEILAQAQGLPEWVRLVEGVTSTGLVGFIVWYVFSRQMPQREATYQKAMTEQAQEHRTDRENSRKDYLGDLSGARQDYMKQLDAMRESFLLEIERQRGFYRDGYQRLHESIEKQGELLRRILERDKTAG